MRHIKVIWDLDDNNNGEPKTFIDAGLPEIVAVPEWMDESEISDWLEDVFDYPPLEYFEFDFSEKNI